METSKNSMRVEFKHLHGFWSDARDALEGTKYGVEYVNQNGGVLGRQIALTYQDNGTNAPKTINQANSMIKDGANNLLITASSSSSVAVNKTVTAREKVLTCASTSQTDDLTIKDFNPYIFAVSGKFDHQAEMPVYIGKVAQSAEYGQAVVEMKEIVPGKDSRPSEQAVMKMRKGD